MKTTYLIWLLVLSAFFTDTLNAQTPSVPEGNGLTIETAYQINSLAHLEWMSQQVALGITFENKYFRQTADIEAEETHESSYNSGLGFQSIGGCVLYYQALTFNGHYNGAGYSIKDLFIDREDYEYVGLFGKVLNATIDSTVLENCQVNADKYVGCIVGGATSTYITNSSASGSVRGTQRVGGLIGMGDDVILSYCYSNCYVKSNYVVGGLIGSTFECSMNNCFNQGVVEGVEFVGGLSGSGLNSIHNCYFSGYLQGDFQPSVIAGYLSNSGGDENLYNDSENCTRHNDTSFTTVDLTLLTTEAFSNHPFTGFDFSEEGTWTRDTSGRPFFKWQKVMVSNGTLSSSGIQGHYVNQSDDVVIEVGLRYAIVDNSELEWVYLASSTIDQDISFEASVLESDTEYYLQTYVRTTSNCYYGDMIKDGYYTFSGGEGTEENPYQISSYQDLQDLSTYVLAGHSFREEFLIQTQDIDFEYFNGSVLANHSLYPIGKFNVVFGEYGQYDGYEDYKPFSGSYNGKGFAISNININRPNESNMGLFGYINKAIIDSVNVENCNITGLDNVGAIIGYSNTSMVSSELRNCKSSGSVNGHDNIGGLIGESFRSHILNCHSTCVVTGSDKVGGLIGSGLGGVSNSSFSGISSGNAYVGGITGLNNTSIQRTNMSGLVVGTEYVGGIAGGNEGHLSNNVIKGAVLGDIHVGSISGRNYNSAHECIATGYVGGDNYTGALVGINENFLSNCFWDTLTTGQGEAFYVDWGDWTVVTSLVTEEFVNNAFEDLDFSEEGEWRRDSIGRPYLNWETTSLSNTAVIQQTPCELSIIAFVTSSDTILERGIRYSLLEPLEWQYIVSENTSTVFEQVLDENLAPFSSYLVQSYAYTTEKAVYGDMVFVETTAMNNPEGVHIREACQSFTWVDGNAYTESNNTATCYISTPGQCDSLIQLDLTIFPLNLNCISNNDGITSEELDAEYQWLDCDNDYAVVEGAVSQSYSPLADGNYAVELTSTECKDTSECINYLVTSMLGRSGDVNSEIQIHPNPSTGNVSLDLGQFKAIDCEVLDVNGKVVYSQSLNNEQQFDINLELEKGIYILRLNSEEKHVFKKLIVK